MPRLVRTVVPLVPIFSGDGDSELTFHGFYKDFAVVVQPDENHKPRGGEHQRWQLIILPPPEKPDRKR